MKKSELIFSAVLLPVDFLMILIAGIFAFRLRFYSFVADIRPVIYEISFREYFYILLIACIVFIIIFILSGLYTIKSRRKFIDEFTKIFISCTASFAILIIFIFFQRELFSSRFIVLFAWVFSIIFTTLGRAIVRLIHNTLLKKGYIQRHIIIVGKGKNTENIVGQIYKKPSLGYKIIERFDDFSIENQNKLRDKLKVSSIDEIIQTEANITKEEVLALKDFCDVNHITFKHIADLLETQAARIEIDTIADIPIIEIKRTKLDGWGRILKRMFDIVFSILLVIILIPLFFIVIILIKIDSQGSVFVKLKRVGEKGTNFKLYKFRSMIKDAHALKKDLINLNERADGPLFKIKNDPRITRIGQFLRKTSIDEIPQFINVIKGEMSLVGPRPHEPEEVAKYEKHHRKLLTIKPGVTGLAQISGRSDLNFEDEARLDIYYIENWSMKLDIQIILKTPFIILSAKSVS